MTHFKVAVADRETGKESVLFVYAADAEEAIASAVARDWLVSEATELLPEPAAAPTPPAVTWELTLWTLRVGVVTGGLLILGGIIVTISYVFYDTTTGSGSAYPYSERVHNIGLLNNRTIGIAVGLTLFLAGVILVGLAGVASLLGNALRARKL